ncbi:MAG TPA: hypothetical protein VHX63_03130 [Acidobacteriaceae bacterium]|nr:hypothetical protein [Acidobacteriaceae bacterium]
MPVTMKTPKMNPAKAAETAPMADDGTRTLLRSGFWILLTGILAGLSIPIFFGGIGIYGPHSNAGWLAFIVLMMNCPFGLMLFLLGVTKWLRNRRLRKSS